MSEDVGREFPWPRVPGSAEAPRWTGKAFTAGDEARRILAFDADESHWSPELTRLHEEEAGANHPIDRASRRLAIRTLQRFVVTKRPVVLDVGCSSGYLLQDIRRALPDAELIGSDYILPPLMQLGQTMPDLPILQFDLRRCPLPDKCIDAVTALNVLEHIDEDETALRHIHRILKPRGIAHIEVPAGPNLFDIYDEHLMHYRRYKLSDLTAMASRIGFDIVGQSHLGFFVYPAFRLVKRRNRKLLARPQLEKKRIVVSQIRESHHALLKLSMRLELAIGRAIRYPFGIRCVVALRRS